MDQKIELLAVAAAGKVVEVRAKVRELEKILSDLNLMVANASEVRSFKVHIGQLIKQNHFQLSAPNKLLLKQLKVVGLEYFDAITQQEKAERKILVDDKIVEINQALAGMPDLTKTKFATIEGILNDFYPGAQYNV